MEKVILVGANLNNDPDFERSMNELEALAAAAEMEAVGRIVQNMETINKAFYIGPGKLDEVKIMVRAKEADVVLFDNSLSPSQLRNIQDELKEHGKENQTAVMDRSALILEIFASRATTREARLQVEVARLQYLLPRLVGLHEALSRQGGGSGSMSNKGTGEKKLELDRRRLEKRLSELRRELKQVIEERKTQRKRRALSGIPRIALVGYTNAGKSTLMNAFLTKYPPEGIPLEEKQVLQKDMLFATLDTTVRKIEPPLHHDFLLSDTVGFIDKLPHNLIEAFKSTLEEAKEADVLLHVVDVSDDQHKEQIEVTNKTLKELEADHIPQVLVYNKADMIFPKEKLPIVRKENEQTIIFMSAQNAIGLDELLDVIEEQLAGGYVDCTLLIPYTEGRALSYLNENGVVEGTEYLPEGTKITIKCKIADYEYYKKYEM